MDQIVREQGEEGFRANRDPHALCLKKKKKMEKQSLLRSQSDLAHLPSSVLSTSLLEFMKLLCVA